MKITSTLTDEEILQIIYDAESVFAKDVNSMNDLLRIAANAAATKERERIIKWFRSMYRREAFCLSLANELEDM